MAPKGVPPAINDVRHVDFQNTAPEYIWHGWRGVALERGSGKASARTQCGTDRGEVRAKLDRCRHKLDG